MGGVRLKDLKSHTNSVGGAWGDDTWAALVKDNCEAVFDSSNDNVEGLDDTQAKRALLIPINVFTSSQIIKIATMTGQTEDYKKLGVDEETPSGVVEDIRNSTQTTGSSYNLVFSDMSSIQSPLDEDEEILFEELERPENENILDDEGSTTPTNVTRYDEDDEEQLEENAVSVNEDTNASTIDENDDMVFTCVQNRSKLSTTMKLKKSRNITVVEQHNKTFFVCPCGFSSTNKSGSSRHKCRALTDIMFVCKDCDKICKNPGSLKRHILAIHRNRQSVSLPVGAGTLSGDLSIPVSESSQDPTQKCLVCGKVLANRRNLLSHIDKMHGQTAGHSVTLATTLPPQPSSSVMSGQF